jgi:hypothetical protein
MLEVESVQGTLPGTEAGWGLHLTSSVASKHGASNTIPSFITSNGPVHEARFKFNPDGSRDGGVHALFTIAGRADATSCADNVEQGVN